MHAAFSFIGHRNLLDVTTVVLILGLAFRNSDSDSSALIHPTNGDSSISVASDVITESPSVLIIQLTT